MVSIVNKHSAYVLIKVFSKEITRTELTETNVIHSHYAKTISINYNDFIY